MEHKKTEDAGRENDNNMGGWPSILGRIDAKPSIKPLIQVPIVSLNKTTEKVRQGRGIKIEEVPEEWKDQPIFLDEQSLPFVLYISDQRWFNSFGRGYKYHFKWCSTLAEKKKNKTDKKYRAKYDICNPTFGVNDNAANRNLKVCLNCCNEFYQAYQLYQFFKAKRKTIEDKFRMPEFFEEFGIIDLPSSTHPGGKDGYARNWPKVSLREKEKVNWMCQDPNHGNNDRDFSRDKRNLHGHHINGVKSDNVSDNLEVVCHPCHAQKPGHGHMKP